MVGALSCSRQRCVLPQASIVVAATRAQIYGFKVCYNRSFLCCHVYDAAYEHASKQKRRCCLECFEQKRPRVKGCNTLPTSGLCFLLGHETYLFVLSYGYILESNFLLFVNFK